MGTESEKGAPRQGWGGWEEITDMHHRPCEWFRVTEYLRIGSCAGACRGGRADRQIKESDLVMKQPNAKDKAGAFRKHHIAIYVNAKQKGRRAREVASLTLFAQCLEQSNRAAGPIGPAELFS